MFDYMFSNHLLPIKSNPAYIIASETIPSEFFRITRISTSCKEGLFDVINSMSKENLF